MKPQAVSTNGRAMNGVPRTRKSLCALSVLVALAVVFVIALLFPQASHAQTSVVGQSTSTNATTEGARKSFFDSSSNTHWGFWYNGTAIEYSSSPDGAAWTSRGTLAYNTPNFSITHKVFGGTSYVFVVTEANTYDVVMRRGSVSGTSVSFDSEETVLDGTSASDTYIRPHVVCDANGKVWTAAFKDLGNVGERYHLTARRTTNRGDQALSFNAANSMGKPSVSVTNVAMVPTTGDKVLAVVSGESSTNVVAYEFDGSVWNNADGGGEQGAIAFNFQDDTVGGWIYALVFDSSGNLFAGGNFNTAGGLTVNRIAKWNGASWSALGTGFNGEVRSLAVGLHGEVYAGGLFTAAGDVAASYIAKWNGTSWSALGGGINGSVFALDVDTTGTLYAGGSFTTADGLTVNRVARWNGATWSPLGAGISGSVAALELDASGNLYVGGTFTTAGSVTANRVAKWDGSSWSALGTGFGNTVRALRFDPSGNLYAGGSFTTAGAVTVNRIAMWNGSTWSSLGAGLNSTVRSVAIDGSGNVYVGGDFTTAGSGTANGGARWNGTSWTALGSANAITPVYAMAFNDSGKLYVGFGGGAHLSGVFTVGDSTSWSGLSPGLNRDLYTITSDAGGNLYAAGSFLSAGGVTVNGIAKWNGVSWSAVGAELGWYVNLLTTDASGNLYAAGTFSTIGGIAANNVARWNGTSWSALGTGLEGDVHSLTVDPSGTLYASGTYTNANDETFYYVSAWDGTSWSSLGTGFDGPVTELATASSGSLYAGGSFTTTDGVAVSNIAQWNGTSWSQVGEAPGGNVSALATDSAGNLYVQAGYEVAKWNGSSWSALGVGLGYGVVWSNLHVDVEGNLYAVGGFTHAGGVPVNGLAKWNGTSWSPVSSPIAMGSNSVSTVTSDSNGNVYVGGRYGISLIRPMAVSNQLAGSTASLTAGANGSAHLTYIDSNNDLMMKSYSSDAGGWSAATTLVTGTITSQAAGFYEPNASLVSWFIEGGTVKYTESSSPYSAWSSPTSVSLSGSPTNISVYRSSGSHSQVVATWSQGGEVVSSVSGVAPTATPTQTPTVTPTSTVTPTPTSTPTLPPPPAPDIEFGTPADFGSGPIVVTRGRRLVVSGTGTAGFSVEIRVDGILVGTVPLAAASGGDESSTRQWSYTLPDLAPGERELTTTYVRTEETRSAPSEPVKIVIVATAPLDFMGMGDTAITTWRRVGSNVRFKTRRASSASWSTHTIRGRYPAAADYDDDGLSDVAAVRIGEVSLEWNVKLSTTGATSRTTLGDAGDTVISGCSFTGNKGASLAVFKSKQRQVQHMNVGDSTPRTVTLNGLGSGNVIGCGDTDGDGVDELLFTTRGADNRIRVVGYDTSGQRKFESKYNSFVRGFVVDRPNSAVPLVAVIGGTERRGRQVKITTMAGSFAFPRFFVERGATIGNGTFTTENNQQVSGIFWANRSTRMVSRRLLSRGSLTTDLFKLPKGFSLVRPQGIVRTTKNER